MKYYLTIVLKASGRSFVSVLSTVTVNDGATLEQLFEHMRQSVIDQHGQDFAKATVTTFQVASEPIGG